MRRWWPFDRRRQIDPWSLDAPFFQWSKHDVLTLGEACQGFQIFGGTGSGKTSGSVAALTQAFLGSGFGGIIFTVKPTDRAFYERLCRSAGRAEDLIVFGPSEPWRYNFLAAELARTDAAAGGATENVVGILSAVLEVCERHAGQRGGDDEGFWRRMNRQLMRNAIELIVRAKGTITIADLYRLVVSAPMAPEQVRSDDWRQRSFCFECLREGDEQPMTPRQAQDFRLAADFFLLEWPNLSDRTRSVVQSTLTSMLDGLMRGIANDLLAGPVTNLTPDVATEGKIILVDLPLLVWREIGQFVQVIWKFCFQRAMERRNVTANPRPVFLIADESHLLFVGADQVFQTTARSSRTVTVFATQSISNYLSVLGGDRAEPQVHALLGNLQSQIFHQQMDVKTNQYAAELIGRTRQLFFNGGESGPPPDWFGALTGWRDRREMNLSSGFSESLEFDVQPAEFANLHQGGPPHWQVEAIVVQGGKIFRASDRPWLRTRFAQFH